MTSRAGSKRAWKVVALVLRVGLILGGSLLLAGVLVGLFTGSTAAPALRLTDLTANVPLNGRLEIAGIVVFAVTPAVGVLALIVAWVRERDWMHTIIAAAVLAILTVGMILGHG